MHKMRFSKWYEAVAVAAPPTKPPKIDEPEDDNNDDGDYERFNDGFFKWTKSNSPCFKNLVTLTSRIIEEHIQVTKTGFRIVPYGGFADVYMEAKGVLIPLLEQIKSAVLRNCDLWKFLGVNYQDAAQLMMKAGFQHWLGNNMLMAIFGNPMFIGDSSSVDSLANFIIFDYFRKNPEQKRELVKKITAERPKAALALDKMYGSFRIQYPDLILVGYLSVHANEDLIGDENNFFSVNLTKEGDRGYMEVFDRKKGKLGHVSFYIDKNKVLRPESNFLIKPDALFVSSLEVLGDWAKKHGYGYGPPTFNTDRESFPLIKRFFERYS